MTQSLWLTKAWTHTPEESFKTTNGFGLLEGGWSDQRKLPQTLAEDANSTGGVSQEEPNFENDTWKFQRQEEVT